MHDCKNKAVAFTLKIKFGPHNLLLAAILAFGESYEVAYILLTLTNRVLNLNIKHIGTQKMTSVCSSA